MYFELTIIEYANVPNNIRRNIGETVAKAKKVFFV